MVGSVLIEVFIYPRPIVRNAMSLVKRRDGASQMGKTFLAVERINGNLKRSALLAALFCLLRSNASMWCITTVRFRSASFESFPK